MIRFSPTALRRLSKLLGMMGSEHDGEVLAAARKANAIVRAAGANWEDLLMQSAEQSAPPPPHEQKTRPTQPRPDAKPSVRFYSGMEIRHSVLGPGFFIRSEGAIDAVIKVSVGEIKVPLSQIHPL